MRQQGEKQQAALLAVWQAEHEAWARRPDLRRFPWWSCSGLPGEPRFSMERYMMCGDGTVYEVRVPAEEGEEATTMQGGGGRVPSAERLPARHAPY